MKKTSRGTARKHFMWINVLKTFEGTRNKYSSPSKQAQLGRGQAVGTKISPTLNERAPAYSRMLHLKKKSESSVKGSAAKQSGGALDLSMASSLFVPLCPLPDLQLEKWQIVPSH